MTLVVVPVRYPLTDHSRTTLETAIRIADERDADISVVHVTLYQSGHQVTRAELKRAVREAVGHVPRASYVVREGLLVEETIIDEVAGQDADVVVIGKKQVSRWRSMIRRLVDDPDIEQYLREGLDCEIITAPETRGD